MTGSGEAGGPAQARDEHLLRAALAETPAALSGNWRRWRACVPKLEPLRPLERRLLPYVWPLAREAGIDDPESAAFDELQKRTWMLNEVLLQQAADVQARLDAAGVPSLLFKGVSLLLRAYADISGRPSADIDVLIRPSDLRRAGGALKTAYPFRSHGAHSLTLMAEGVQSVDLHAMPSHWTLARGAAREEEDRLSRMLDRAETVERASRSFTIPGATDLLFLHLLNVFAHGPHRGIDHAYCLVDARVLLGRCDIDEDRFVALVGEHRCLPLFQYRLAADAALLPAALRPLAARIAALEPTGADRAVRRALSGLVPAERRGRASWRDWWLALRGHDPAAPSLASRLAFIAFSARALARDVAVSAERRRKLFTRPALYLRKTLGQLRR